MKEEQIQVVDMHGGMHVEVFERHGVFLVIIVQTHGLSADTVSQGSSRSQTYNRQNLSSCVYLWCSGIAEQ